MIDPDELDAIAEAVLAEEDQTFSLPVAPGSRAGTCLRRLRPVRRDLAGRVMVAGGRDRGGVMPRGRRASRA